VSQSFDFVTTAAPEAGTCALMRLGLVGVVARI